MDKVVDLGAFTDDRVAENSFVDGAEATDFDPVTQDDSSPVGNTQGSCFSGDKSESISTDHRSRMKNAVGTDSGIGHDGNSGVNSCA